MRITSQKLVVISVILLVFPLLTWYLIAKASPTEENQFRKIRVIPGLVRENQIGGRPRVVDHNARNRSVPLDKAILRAASQELFPVLEHYPYLGKGRRSGLWPLIGLDGELTDEAASDAGLNPSETKSARKIFAKFASKMDELVASKVEENTRENDDEEEVSSFTIRPFSESSLDEIRSLVEELDRNFGNSRQIKLLEKFDITRYSGMGSYKTTVTIRPFVAGAPKGFGNPQLELKFKI